MPLASIHLFALEDSNSLLHLLNFIKSSAVRPFVVSKPIKWVIVPEKIQTKELLNPKWDLLLVLQEDQSSKQLIARLLDKSDTSHQWAVKYHHQTTAGIPSRLTNDFSKVNQALLHPISSSVPKLTGAMDNPLIKSSSQSLTLSPELQSWVKSFSGTKAGQNAVSMLNFLAFKPDLKSSYLQYGKAFGESIGARRGGNAKLVGNIVYDKSKEQAGDKWDEFALAHYPSIMHFADMLASEDYQAVNQKYRVPSLKDTCILCTSEIEIEELLKQEKAMGTPKL